MVLSKKRWTMVLAIVLCLTMVLGAIPAQAGYDGERATRTEPKTYKSEAEGKTFFVSPDGNDSNAGTLEAPFKSITKARDTVRAVIATGMDENITVYIRGGSYYLDAPLTFSSDDSGRDGYKIIYKAYQDEVPQIYGGQAITGWEAYQGNIYRAKVPKGTTFNTVTENGERSVVARYPNKGLVREGYLKVAETAPANINNNFIFSDADGIPRISNIQDLQVNCWPGGTGGEFNWVQEIINVSSIDYDEHNIALATRTNYEMGAGSRYFLQGAIEFLDSPGEFYLDTANNYVYYYPKNLPIKDQEIVYPKTYSLVSFNGAGTASPVQDIELCGLFLSTTDSAHAKGQSVSGGGITMKYAQNITVRDCELCNIGLDGIKIDTWARNNYITGNHIHNIGEEGINIFAGWAIASNLIEGNVVTNNHIHHVSEINGASPMIGLGQTGSNYIANNLLHDGGRFALSIGSQCVLSDLKGKTLGGTLVTEDNMWDFQFARENVVEFNDMSNVMNDSQDGGVYYSWGAGANNWLNNNWLHDSGIHFSFGFGLYMDDESCYFDVTNNIVSGLQQRGEGGTLNGGIYVKGWGNELYNNFAINNNARAGLTNGYDTDQHGPVYDIKEERNLLYNSANNDTVHSSGGWREDKYTSLDYNLYYQDSGIYTVGEGGGYDLETFQSMYDRKYDQNSITGDPYFMDVDNNDFRLAYNSVAHALGIEDIDMYSIGLKEDFKYNDESDPLSRLFITSDTDGSAAYVNVASGEDAQLSVKGRSVTGFAYNMANADITFTSDNEGVATVDQTGKVTGVSGGKANITATVMPKSNGTLPESIASRMSNAIALVIDQPTAFVNGTSTMIDPANSQIVPFIRDDRTLVPIRFVSEALGATVTWDDATRTVRIVKDNTKIIMVVGQNTYNKNRRDYTMDTPSIIYGDRTYVPLRVVSEALGKEVQWDDATRSIIISDTPNIISPMNEPKEMEALVKSFPVPQTISTTVLVDDSFAAVEPYASRSTMRVGETLTIQAFGKTANGRYLNTKDADITFQSSNNGVATVDNGGNVIGKALGDATITASVTMDGVTQTGSMDLHVVDATITKMTATLADASLNPGSETDVVIKGTLSDGRDLDVSEATATFTSSNPEIATVDASGHVVAVSKGTTSVTVDVNRYGYERRAIFNVIVFDDAAGDPIPEPWKKANLGPAAGTLNYDAASGKYTIYSNGENVWGTSDKCTMLYQTTDSEEGDEVIIESHILDCTKASPDTSLGVMLRSSMDDNAKMLHLRLRQDGEILVAYRTEIDGSCGYTFSGNKYPKTGVKLRLVYKAGVCTYYEVYDDGSTLEIGHVDIDLGSNVIAGVAFFSNDTSQMAEGHFLAPTVTVNK